MDQTQLLKGVLEGCVLSIIEKETTYGYEILSVLSEYGFKDIQDGTLYPILKRLEVSGYIVSEKIKSELGPKRKYYTITNDGKDYLKSFTQTYRDLSKQVMTLLGEEKL